MIPVFLRDKGVEALGAAPKMRIGMGVAKLAQSLAAVGSRLVLRRGPALEALRALVAETGAGAVWWTRLHDLLSRRRDEGVAKGLGIEARAFPGHLLHEPETVRTGAGGAFKVYGPYFRAVRARDPGEPLPAPGRLVGPEIWPPPGSGWRTGGSGRR